MFVFSPGRKKGITKKNIATVGVDIIIKLYTKHYWASCVPGSGILSLIVAGSTYNFCHNPA